MRLQGFRGGQELATQETKLSKAELSLVVRRGTCEHVIPSCARILPGKKVSVGSGLQCRFCPNLLLDVLPAAWGWAPSPLHWLEGQLIRNLARVFNETNQVLDSRHAFLAPQRCLDKE